jgi:hypothetical protein
MVNLLAYRRLFTVSAFLVAWAVLVSGCRPASTPAALTLAPTQTLLPSATALLEPSITISPSSTLLPTDLPTAIPSSTSTPTASPAPCLKLIFPENGSDLPAEGLISFLWDEQPGASSYLLEILPPGGKMVTFTTTATLRNQYAEALPWGGEHKWQVVALDPNGKTICTSQPFTFTKPKPPAIIPWTATPQPGELMATVPTKTSTPRTLTPQPSQ